MEASIQAVRARAIEECIQVENLEELQQLRVKFLGKKGEVTQLLRVLGGIPAEQRRW